MTSIKTIKSVLNQSGGPAQPCHYICNIIPPVAMFTGGSGLLAPIKAPLTAFAARQVSILAESVSLPGKQLMTTPHKIFGTKREMPYGVVYAPLNINFICTNSMIERTFFDVWHQFIIGPTSQYMEYYETYVGQIIIQKIANDDAAQSAVGQVMATYFLEEVYPKSISEQELSYSSGDEYLKLSIEFEYARWSCTLDNLFPGDSEVVNPLNPFPLSRRSSIIPGL
jgi:hypothetical protein